MGNHVTADAEGYILMLGGVIGLTVLGGIGRHPDEDKAVAFLRQLGGFVGQDGDRPGIPAKSLSLQNTKATDTDLKRLASLATPRFLPAIPDR